ncbi:MAG: hypothetical protein V2J55_10155 [Candidatus Competibacteraceae bacterium]|jgi:hypothetical protein|nr:hypothetical protein [Candidatus Competibacteraceae bacterium]
MNTLPPTRFVETHLSQCVTNQALLHQNQVFRGTGGVSHENRSSGFVPAFQDSQTGTVYLSRFADGRPAPMHLLEGLPQSVVVARNETGKINAIKPSVVAGFVRCGQFYTREQAAASAMN